MSKIRQLASIILLIFLVLIISALISGEANALWFDSNWGFRQMITIKSSQVPGDLVNFPVLVSVTDSNLRLMPNGNVGNADGSDIAFTMADSFTQIDHEIESYNPGTGRLAAWVEVPNLSSTMDTNIFIYYGNPGAADQQNINGTWNSDFAGVWHMKEEQAGAGNPGLYRDSTINGNDGNDFISDTDQSGQINGAQGFDGVDDYITISNIPLTNTSGHTISAWVRPNGIQQSLDPVVYCCNASNAGFRMGSNNRIGFTIRNAAFAFTSLGSIGSLTADVWNHVVIVYDFATDSKFIYLNGIFDNSTGPIGGLDPGFYDGSSDFNLIGGQPTTTRWFDGNIDEIEISSIARSPDWIETSFNNQNNPTFFISIGAQEEFVPVPTMSKWGMIVFMMLAGIGAVYYIWRRRIAETDIYTSEYKCK